MKWYILGLFLVAAVLAQEDSSEEELPLAESCDAAACQLPDCRCSSTSIPGGLAARDTPQFVLLTFDDGINVLNIETYRRLIYNRLNSNNCPASVTFYVSHEYTNYQLVNELYNRGFEIALHSMSHKTDQQYWRDATYEDMMNEFGGQRRQMAHFANIPIDQIKGVRLPFLQMTGNASFQVMADVGLTYDASWPTTSFINPGLWPYTLDYASSQDCIIPPCPSASFPGVWVLPIVSWLDTNGGFCSFADACFYQFRPALDDEEGWYEFILGQFERHYMNNRAPFGFYVHEAFISANPAIERALSRFLDLVNRLPDAFMVASAEVIDWVKNPVPLEEYKSKQCRSFPSSFCPATSCTLTAAHNDLTYWTQFCNTCPRVYPWLGNPLGE
ncbi:polysaccharide deacetylase domain-containing protein [Phthorimaea operculella]|nr:polysaccharide deacetylase domain-containing protein [Phthorimaea operculella]